MSAGGERLGEGTASETPEGEPVVRRRQTDGDFYTPSEAARALRMPLRSVLEWLAAGEIEAELDPLSGRWKIPEASLKSSEPVRQTKEELAWRYEKERLLAELHGERERAERERERADRERDRADREREQAEGLRKELEIARMKGSGGMDRSGHERRGSG